MRSSKLLIVVALLVAWLLWKGHASSTLAPPPVPGTPVHADRIAPNARALPAFLPA